MRHVRGTGRRRPAARRSAGEIASRALSEFSHEFGLPWTPCRRARGDRIRFSQCGQKLEGAHRSNLIGNKSNSAFVFEIATAGNIWQQQVMTNHRFERLDVCMLVAHPDGDALYEFNSNDAVITRVALTNVMEQCAQHQKVRPLDPIGESSRLGCSFQQVPVDGEAVVRVALGSRSNRQPLGQQAGDQLALF